MEFIDITRFALAFFSGYFLSLGGSLSQIATNNPLSSPSTLGMSGIAVFVVMLSQFLIIFAGFSFSLETLSFVTFSLVFCSLLFFSFAKRKNLNLKSVWRAGGTKNIILIGIVFNLLIGAIFSIVQFLFISLNFEFPNELWFGNFRYYTNFSLYLFFIIFSCTNILIFKMKGKLEILNLGEGFSRGLGLDTKKLQLQSLFIALFLSGVVISFFGVFSFLGLIFPHILRSFSIFKKSINNELAFGPYLCGVVLSVIDLICYNFTIQGVELPVGMVSSVLGSLFMIGIIFKMNKLS